MSARSRVVPGAALLALLLLSPARPIPTQASLPEVEPTMPLLLEVRFEGVERAAALVRARLVIDLTSARAIDDIELSLALPEGLQVAAPWPLPRGLARLERGERRHYVLPLIGAPDRDWPVRLEATYPSDGGDGRQRVGQGATLAVASTPVEGRLVAGAYEVPAVLLQDLKR